MPQINKLIKHQKPAFLTSSENEIIHNLLNETMFNQFLASNFPSVASKLNFNRIIQVLTSKDPNQTISVTSAYDLSAGQTINLFTFEKITTFSNAKKAVFDLKRCMVYTFKNVSQLNYSRLASYYESYDYCTHQDGIVLGNPLFIQEDRNVANIIKLFKACEKMYHTYNYLC